MGYKRKKPENGGLSGFQKLLEISLFISFRAGFQPDSVLSELLPGQLHSGYCCYKQTPFSGA